MDLGLKDKVFIVTGGSKGIGEGISRAISEEGGIPVIASRSDATEFVAELNQNKINASSIQVELSTPENCKKVIDHTIKAHGRIDGVVNNAGVNDGVGLEDGPSDFRASINKNLYHYYDLVHFALPYLKKTKGSIVNISSKVAQTGQGGTSGYAASKGAQLGLTREWAVELLPHEIRVNAILPAEVMTPLYRKWLDSFDDPAAKEHSISEKIPLGKRMTTKEEIAAAVVFLLSDKSAHTTGQFFFIDGGYTHLDRSL
jgi:L-fucose dehydrogenase